MHLNLEIKFSIDAGHRNQILNLLEHFSSRQAQNHINSNASVLRNSVNDLYIQKIMSEYVWMLNLCIYDAYVLFVGTSHVLLIILENHTFR